MEAGFGYLQTGVLVQDGGGRRHRGGKRRTVARGDKLRPVGRRPAAIVASKHVVAPGAGVTGPGNGGPGSAVRAGSEKPAPGQHTDQRPAAQAGQAATFQAA